MTLAQNQLAEALLGVRKGYTGLRRSLFYRWFTDPAERLIHPEDEHDMHSRGFVAWLRAIDGRTGEDPEIRNLIEHLLRESDEFTELWQRHEVGSRSGTLKRFVHPLVGTMILDCQILTSENGTERLVVFTATPGSEDADRLALLSVIGAQEFPSDPAVRAA